MAGARKLLRGSQTGRTGTDNGNRLARLSYRQNRSDKTFIKAAIDNVPFDNADRDRIFIDAEDAGTFARRRAETSGEFWEIVRTVQRLQRIIPTSTIDEIIPP